MPLFGLKEGEGLIDVDAFDMGRSRGQTMNAFAPIDDVGVELALKEYGR